ncbi:MAG: DUF4258 domain-containing protein [candidate division NC10 bacterium]|nr:DUF4258 domain-containing protein [candidate division NC10 bacterium]
MDIEILRDRVRAGNYLIKSHAVQHAIKEGFDRQHIVEAIITGTIIEEYPDEQRVLVCGCTTLAEKVEVYLHVVCEYADPVYTEVVTAYIPNELEWEKPPFKRRRRKRR